MTSQTANATLAAGGEYTWPVQVRHYELDRTGRVRAEVYLNWLQELGVLASAYCGFPLARYEAMGAFWWVRRFWIEWQAAAGYGDVLAATTWISEFRRLRCNRQYLIRRQDDGRVIFGAQAEWAFVDVASGQPARIPADMLTAFPVQPHAAISAGNDFVAAPHEPVPAARDYTSTHTVQRHEVDTMGHVNNAQYLVWLFENLAESVESDVRPERLDVAYLHPARAGDRLNVRCRRLGQDGPCGVWQHEVTAVTDGAVVIRARSRCRVENGRRGPRIENPCLKSRSGLSR
jgi:acyl-CoA thioester hydrolase